MATARTTKTNRAKINSAKKAAPKKAAAKKAAAKKAPVKKPAAKKATPKGAASSVTMDDILGQITRLMMTSPQHRHMFLSDMEVQVMPPLHLRQCRVLRDDEGQPLAYASWARVSDDVHARLEGGQHRLRPGDWNSGPHPWLIDVAAPPHVLPQVLAELQENVFKGETVRTLMKRSAHSRRKVQDQGWEGEDESIILG